MHHDLIVFGEDWGGLPSSTQHLISRLSSSRKVVWVNSIGLRQPSFNLRDCKRLLAKVSKIAFSPLQSPQQSKENTAHPPSSFTIVNPITIPAPSSRVSRKLAEWLLVYQLRPLVKKLSLENPVLWSSLPTAADLCGKLGESSVIYYCGDDFGALAGVDHDVVLQHERVLVSKADKILAASPTLCDKFPSDKCLLLPHGVDYDLFSNSAPRAKDLPDDGHPIAGFYGSLSNWLDYDLLKHVITRLKHWRFVFIGNIEDERAHDILRLKNVIYLGQRPHNQLPSYSQHWDVSLLPFSDNLQIRACNPLKLLEYLATGKPVVTTPFPALKPYQHLVQTVATSRQMVSALEKSISGKNVKSTQQLQEISTQTWDQRARDLTLLLEAL
ncbi:glycosyltransferase [Parasalinivibrio latis]|uniref:glycosyltransferase n=1 Tax=Parasalinivibrio latis TaxID=2952610 RepID=UPI0030E19B91